MPESTYIGGLGVIKPVATGHWLPPVWITQIMLLWNMLWNVWFTLESDRTRKKN